MKIYSSEGVLLLDVEVDDTSYRQRVIKGDNNVTLRYSLDEHVELPVGAYCQFENERYTLMRPESFKMKHSRNFDYTVLLESSQANAKIWKFRNPVDGRIKFQLTAKPIEHLQMFVDNMNRRDSGWSVGECIDGAEQTINYDHDFCWDALSKQAEQFETEFEIVGKVASLHKVEYNKSNPLPLSYGIGNGFKPNVGRANSGDNPPVEILFVEGGSDNIDRSTYGNAELLLPTGQTIAYDGEHFEDEEGFVSGNARTYVVDELGLSIRRTDKPLSSQAEDSLDCSHIYPKRVGKVSSVVVEDAAKNFYDIVDDSIPAGLNYEDCIIAGESMTIVFQSGMLAGDGKEFEVKYHHTSVDGKAARRFEIVPQEIDGMTMPGGVFIPREGDTYAVFNCNLPNSYIRDDASKSGASWDMFREAVRYMFDNEEQQYSFTGELDGIWAKKDWNNIGGRIRLGGYIEFHDERFQKVGVLVRITGIKDFINDPHSPTLTLSNQSVGGGFSSEMKRLQSEEVTVWQNHKSALQYTKRRFRDAQETISMLESALLNNFTNSINPVSVQTMAMLIGDESLQFQFVDNMKNPQVVAHNVVFNEETQVLTVPAGIIQHMTLGINTISSSHDASEYHFWSLPEFNTAPLLNGDAKYYLYAKVSRTSKTGEFRISESAIAMNAEADCYYLLMGVLNSAYDGERSFVTLYGFSEVLPGRITTERIATPDGLSFIDLLNGAFKLRDKFQFNVNGDGQLKIKGGISQNSGGYESPIGVYRGKYDNNVYFYYGDRVQYEATAGTTSTYTYIAQTPSKGHLPTETLYWRVDAAGVKGADGKDGAAGKDGIDGAYTDFKYAKNTSKTDAPALNNSERQPEGWSNVPPSISEGEHLWMTQAEIKADNTLKEAWSAPVRLTGIDGKDGATGVPGIDGEDGRTSYFHIRYADVENPTTAQMKTTPAAYIGTYVDFTAADSSDPADYTWSKFQGKDGANGKDGIPGVNGEDGKTSYLHIRYSNDGGQTFATDKGLRKVSHRSIRLLSNGVFRYTDDNIGEVEGDYIGVYVDDVEADSNDVFRYKWTRLRGYDGQSAFKSIVFMRSAEQPAAPTGGSYSLPVPDGWSDGIPNTDNAGNPVWMSSRVFTNDGKEPQSAEWTTPQMAADTAEIDFEFSSVEENPGTPTQNPTNWHDKAADGDIWLAVRKNSNGVWGDWEISKIKGENGDWVSYAFKQSDTQPETPTGTDPIPTGWKEAPDSAGIWWMSKATINGGTGKAGKWSFPVKVVGEDGKNGLPGVAGADGRTSYFHVRYSDVESPTEASQMKKTPAAYIGTYVDFTAADSDNPADYTWSKFMGADGANGKDGTSITIKSTSVTYAVTGTAAQPADSAFTSATLPSIAVGEFLWSKTVVIYSDNTQTKSYSVSRIGADGEDGLAGSNGIDGKTTYVHIAYAKNATGSEGFSTQYFDGALYIGTCTDYNPTDPTVSTAYVWARLKGEDGKDGTNGKDGTSITITGYSIMYQKSQSGTVTPTGMWQTSVPATVAGEYLWTRTVVNYSDGTSTTSYAVAAHGANGANGKDGIPGVNGEDGKTSYLHIKFSNDGGQTFASDKCLRKVTHRSLRLLGNGGFRITDDNLGEVEGEYMGYYVDDVKEDSADVFRYSWKRIKGEDGVAGNYYEYRYQKNGSTTVPPSLTKNVLEPSGWSKTMPAVGALEYLWLTIAEKSGDGLTLVQEWSTPVRMTPYDGKDGAQGESPVLVYRGIYDASKTYYGNSNRLDAVKYNGTYYIARIDAGAFSGIAPTDKTKWNDFGAQFESIATNLLLAEGANIGDWFISGGKIVSTLSDGNKITLDAKAAKILIKSLITGGDYSLDNDYSSTISIDAASGMVEARNNNGVAYLSASGIFCNNAKTNALPLSSGYTHYGAVVGIGFGDVDRPWEYDTDGNVIAGVYGRASNSGNAPAYGGYFWNLMAAGLILRPKYIADNASYYLYDGYTQCFGLTNSGKTATVYLPTGNMEGNVIFAKQIGAGQMRFRPRSGQYIFDDISNNEYYDVPEGWEAKFTFAVFNQGGVIKEAWFVSRWKF